ncbi:MAG: hypothetical protein IJY93_02985 [Clostridia bacterium]|nr:hypothetical protein [Clostridia bacterium]
MIKGICINQDSHDVVSAAGRTRPSADTVKNFPKIYEGTHVTDFFINLMDTCAIFPSKTRTSFLDKYYQKEENGTPVDYTKGTCGAGMHYLYEELGIDYVKEHIKGFREAGINPWLTYRMNDYHDRNHPTSMLFSDFFHEHPEVRNGRDLPKYLWNGDEYAYDFKFEIVRAHNLDLINESLELYDPYGIELDFQREMSVFALGEEFEGVEIMNGFMRDVDEIVKKAEQRWGHKIRIAVRIMPDIHFCYEYGFDVMHWVQEGIVDTVVISGRWASTDTDMPIAMWKSLLSPYGAELFASMEYFVCAHTDAQILNPNIDTFTACAANAFAQGADKFYIYNYYVGFDTEFNREGEFDFDPTKSVRSREQYWTVINTLGDPEKVTTLNRRHIVTLKDRMPIWRRNTYTHAPESRGTNQLPLTFCQRGAFRLIVGEIPESATVTFRFSVDDIEKALANKPSVWMNNVPCEYIGSEMDERFTPHPLLCYDVPASAFKTCMTALISSPNDAEVTTRWVDIYVKTKN